MTDPILAAIDRQKSSACLYALRIHLRRDGKWSDDLYNSAFDAKTVKLEAGWAK